jgi:PAS domain S-box-containing protein
MSTPSPDVLAVLEATFDAVVIMDDRGRILAFNASAEEMFGYRRSDALGRNVSMLMTAVDRLNHDEHVKRYLAGGEARVIGKGRDVRVRHRDGSEFSVFLSVGRIPGTEPPQFVGYLHDTSLRRKALATLEKERQLNRLYLDLAQVMLVATDRSGIVRLVNQRAVRVLKRTDAELVGSLWVDGCVANRRVANTTCAAPTAKIVSSPGAASRCATPTTSRPASCCRARTSPISAARRTKRTRRWNA